MSRKFIFIVAAVGLLLAACSSPTTEEAAQNLCSSLAGLEASIAQVAALGPDSTVDDAESAREELEDAWNDVKDDAEVVNEAAANEAEDALDQFNDAIDDISGDSSLAEAAAQALTAAQGFSAALGEIESSLTCE